MSHTKSAFSSFRIIRNIIDLFILMLKNGISKLFRKMHANLNLCCSKVHDDILAIVNTGIVRGSNTQFA